MSHTDTARVLHLFAIKVFFLSLSPSPSRLHVSEDSSSLSVILHVSLLAFSLGQGREGHFVFLLFCCRGTTIF